ncbi:MAG: HIRAN domain-containing protein [Olegusella sp.]|nr:HIRAN domain-containing protein [Olegusella sp.]
MAEKKDAWGMGRTQEKHGDPEPHDAQGAPKPNEAQDAQDSHGQLPTALVLAGGGSALGTLSGGNGEGGSLSLPRPFAHRICLIEETRVAGTTHAPEIEEAAEELTEGRELRFVREPGNLVDKWAIQVYAGEHRIGYVAADRNEILARLMDGGKRLVGEVVDHELVGHWHKVTMGVWLDD